MNKTFIFYLFVEFVACFLFYVGLKQEKLKNIKNGKIKIFKNPYIILSMLTLLLVVALRDISVGTDYVNYRNFYLRIYQKVVTKNEIKTFGILFYFLAKIFTLIFKSKYIFFYGFIGGLTIYFIYRTCIDYSKNPWLSLYMLFSFCLYYQIFNQLRQLLAMFIVVYAIRYIWQKNFKKYFLFIIIASSIHLSAIMMLPLYFFLDREINVKTLIMYLYISAVLFLGVGLFRKIIEFTSYRYYLGSVFDSSFSLNAILNFIVRLFMLFVCLLFRKKIVTNNPKTKLYYHAIVICTILQFLTIRLTLFGRLTTYFYLFYIFLIPEIFYVFFENKKTKKTLLILFLVAMLGYHYVYFNSSFAATSGYNNYKFLKINW